MADDLTSLIYLVFAIGVGTGIMFIIPILFFLVKNRLRKDWVWAIIRGRDGRYRTRELKPDGSHLNFKKWTAEIDSQHPSTFKKGILQAPRSAWLYNEGDPRPVNLKTELVPELDKEGKKTGKITAITNPDSMFLPGEAWHDMLGSHITRDALGRTRMELLLLIVAILAAFTLFGVFGLFLK